MGKKGGSISSDGGTFLKARFFLLKRTDTQQKRGEIREREGGVEESLDEQACIGFESK